MSNSPVTIIGNAVRDPELRFTPSGAAVAQFGVAVNRRWQDRTTNEWQEEVSFFDVTCWREQAENVCESVEKGTRVVVHGRLEQQRWTSDTGENRSKVIVIADEVAVSLRWATADVTKIERRDAGSRDGAPLPEPPGGGAQHLPEPPPLDDEEPF